MLYIYSRPEVLPDLGAYEVLNLSQENILTTIFSSALNCSNPTSTTKIYSHTGITSTNLHKSCRATAVCTFRHGLNTRTNIFGNDLKVEFLMNSESECHAVRYDKMPSQKRPFHHRGSGLCLINAGSVVIQILILW